MALRFVYAVACVKVFLIFKSEYYSIVCVYHILFIQSSINGHLDCFYLWAIENNDAMSMDIQISLWDVAFNSFRYIPQIEFLDQLVIPFYIPPNRTQGFQFPHILTNTYFVMYFLTRSKEFYFLKSEMKNYTTSQIFKTMGSEGW